MRPCSYLSVGTPHLGSKRPVGDRLYHRVKSQLVDFYLSTIIGRTGRQLGMLDVEDVDGVDSVDVVDDVDPDQDRRLWLPLRPRRGQRRRPRFRRHPSAAASERSWWWPSASPSSPSSPTSPSTSPSATAATPLFLPHSFLSHSLLVQSFLTAGAVSSIRAAAGNSFLYLRSLGGGGGSGSAPAPYSPEQQDATQQRQQQQQQQRDTTSSSLLSSSAAAAPAAAQPPPAQPRPPLEIADEIANAEWMIHGGDSSLMQLSRFEGPFGRALRCFPHLTITGHLRDFTVPICSATIRSQCPYTAAAASSSSASHQEEEEELGVAGAAAVSDAGFQALGVAADFPHVHFAGIHDNNNNHDNHALPEAVEGSTAAGRTESWSAAPSSPSSLPSSNRMPRTSPLPQALSTLAAGSSAAARGGRLLVDHRLGTRHASPHREPFVPHHGATAVTAAAAAAAASSPSSSQREQQREQQQQQQQPVQQQPQPDQDDLHGDNMHEVLFSKAMLVELQRFPWRRMTFDYGPLNPAVALLVHAILIGKNMYVAPPALRAHGEQTANVLVDILLHDFVAECAR